jgi:predicted amidohydrolase YtcJ
LKRTSRPFVRLAVSLFVLLFCFAAPIFGQGSASERLFFNGKVFTGDPINPYAEAVAIRGGKIAGVGTLAEAAASVSAGAERVDLGGKTLFPGLIDAHSHAAYGGMSLISADASEKIKTVAELAAFAAEAKRSGRGMQGDILEIQGIPLEIWSHNDELQTQFGTGAYKEKPVLLEGMDGHTAWANPALLERAGITAAFLKGLSADERSYYGVGKDAEPTGFLVDAGKQKIQGLLPAPDDARLLAAGRAMLAYNYGIGITAWIDPIAAPEVLRTYKLLIDHGELGSVVDAFPRVYPMFGRFKRSMPAFPTCISPESRSSLMALRSFRPIQPT